MGDNLMAPGPVHRDRMADEPAKPGPADAGRTVEEPARPVDEPEGLDRTPTEPIPAEGDSPSAEVVVETPEEPAAPLPAGRVPEPPGNGIATFFDEGTVAGFRDRWRELQADFVDDPARAVRNADGLVDEIMRELAKRKDGLEERWRDGPGDTEELRVAMTEYRSFFNQLLNA